jgi:hypothetical protein
VIEAAPGVRGILRFSGRIDRCALAEITEVNPPSPVEVHPEAHLRGRELTVATPELETSAVVTVEGPAGHWVVGGSDDTLLSEIEAGPGTSGPVEVTITVSLDSPVWPGDPQRTPTVTAPRIAPGDAADGLAGVTTGALRYILGCTAFDVGGGDRAILTDHRLLPLSWTRDAYYQALLLLCAAPDDRAVTDVVQGHLRWLWGRGRAPGTPWMRSHLPDGRPKDLAIQADQQLYPLLELADYRRVTGRWPVPPVGGDAEPVKRWGELIEEVWRSLPRQGESGLLADAENPADDPSELPFTLSTQILYWHTAIQLAPYATELGLAALHLESTAQDLRIAVRRAFTCEGPYGPQWAYETDGAGHHRLYHDANDLPTAFAPSWGFCSSGDRQWAATMRFAFSEHNPAYVSGLHGGLGSAHTLGTWPLGDAQELAVAITTGDKDRATAVRCRVNRVAAVDGLLPETYDPETGDWLARHWFAWPAAVFGVLHLGIKLG